MQKHLTEDIHFISQYFINCIMHTHIVMYIFQLYIYIYNSIILVITNLTDIFWISFFYILLLYLLN